MHVQPPVLHAGKTALDRRIDSLKKAVVRTMSRMHLSAQEPLDRVLLTARRSTSGSRDDEMDRHSSSSKDLHAHEQREEPLLAAVEPLKDSTAVDLGGPEGPGQASEPAEEDTLEWYGDLKQYSRPRRACIRVSTSPDFELLVMLVIVANCVTLALYRPLEPQSSPWNARLFVAGAHTADCSAEQACLHPVGPGRTVF